MPTPVTNTLLLIVAFPNFSLSVALNQNLVNSLFSHYIVEMFFNKTPRPSASKELMLAIRAKYDLTENDGVSVSQIACSHPECGDAETVILILKANEKTRAIKILKPLSTVTLEDLEKTVE
jgi:transcriptional regulator of NAD metabolism